MGIDQLLFRRLGNDDNCLNSSHSLRPSAFVNVLFVQAIIIIALVASKVVVYSLIDQHLLRFRAPILWINPWLCTVRVNPCTVRDYTSLHTSIVKISLLSSLYHIAGKQPGNLNVSFYVIQHLLPQCPQTDSVGGNDANYAKAGVNPYEWQTWSYTTSIPHLIIQHLKDYISPSI